MKISFTVFIAIITSTLFSQVNTTKNRFTTPKGAVVNLQSQPETESTKNAVTEMPKQGPEQRPQTTHKTRFVHQKKATINFEEITKDYSPSLLVSEMPKQGAEKMEVYNYPQKKDKESSRNNQTQSILGPLVKFQSFAANPYGSKTPNDNDIAISDSGLIISVINSNIYIRNSVTNFVYTGKSLTAFTSPVNNDQNLFDPKVIYDPQSDRFVLVCLVGTTDSTSKIIVGFTQTNNPAGNWNLYTLPGDPLNYGLWSDYPMIAMTEKELFLSINLLYNDSTWQAGFVETLVWQINKKEGYSGAALTSDLHSNIKFNGKAIRNLCPVKGGSQLYSPNMHFVSNRNLASQNDTVFLVNITDTIGSPTGSVQVQALITDQAYYFPNKGRQPSPIHLLATNDCRNLGAYYENGLIHYVHNTNNPSNSRVTIYYGVITGIGSNPSNLSIKGYILPNDTMDYGYPNISYAGKSATDNTSIITFNHSSNLVNPGCSAVSTDGLGNFSPVLTIQNGSTYINVTPNNQERWGDYSGSQRRYNSPGEVWMSGYQGRSHFFLPHAHGAWIAQIKTDTSTVGIKNYSAAAANAAVYPNPVKDFFSVEVSLAKPEYLNFELLDAQGKLIDVLLRDWVKGKENLFSFSTRDLSTGIYFLKITGNYNTSVVKKIIIH